MRAPVTKDPIPTWLLTEISDPNFKWKLAEDPDSIRGLVDIHFSNGVLRTGKRLGLVNLFWFTIPLTFSIPLRIDHFIKKMPFNRENLCKAWMKYYDEIMGMDIHNAKLLKKAIWQVWQDLYQFCSINLIPWVGTLDILDFAEIMEDPAIKPIIETKEKITPSMGTDVIETYVDSHSKEIMKLMGTKGALQNEALYPYQNLSLLNKFQVPQTIYAFGVRTDVSDNIIGLPVVGSALSGLRDIKEYAVESLSAKKSAFYNQISTPESQYLGRKIHLLVSILQHIYARDCGSTLLIPFQVTAKNCMNLIGKLIYVDGHPVHLDEVNVKNYIDQTIHMRSPMTCRFRNGVCQVCGGKIFDNINRKINIGVLSAVQVIEPTTQKILSAKHLVKTTSIIYELPEQANKVLIRTAANEIHWRPQVYSKIKKHMLGVSLKDVHNIHDIALIRADKPVKEERFSRLTCFEIKDAEGKKNHYSLETADDQLPFLSTEMLFHMKERNNKIVIDEEMMWIPIEGTDTIPIFRTIVINDNTRLFVGKVSRFLSSDISEYTSCADALEAFSSIIYEKVNANIVHLEVLLKAFLISSPGDYRVPRVEDPNKVMFQTLNAVLTNRNVGTKLAYQGLAQYMCQPSTYLVQHQSSPFDPLAVGME